MQWCILKDDWSGFGMVYWYSPRKLTGRIEEEYVPRVAKDFTETRNKSLS